MFRNGPFKTNMGALSYRFLLSITPDKKLFCLWIKISKKNLRLQRPIG